MSVKFCGQIRFASQISLSKFGLIKNTSLNLFLFFGEFRVIVASNEKAKTDKKHCVFNSSQVIVFMFVHVHGI